jgi:hypothetical protein
MLAPKITAVPSPKLQPNNNPDVAKVIFSIEFLFFAAFGTWILYTNVCTIRGKVLGAFYLLIRTD